MDNFFDLSTNNLKYNRYFKVIDIDQSGNIIQHSILNKKNRYKITNQTSPIIVGKKATIQILKKLNLDKSQFPYKIDKLLLKETTRGYPKKIFKYKVQINLLNTLKNEKYNFTKYDINIKPLKN